MKIRRLLYQVQEVMIATDDLSEAMDFATEHEAELQWETIGVGSLVGDEYIPSEFTH